MNDNIGEATTADAATAVFLSYNHNDVETVLRLQQALQQYGIAVRIDKDSIAPGQDIRAFIAESIRATQATVWVVSEASLLSGWVAVEIGNTLHDVELWSKRRLLPCTLDDGFLDSGFRLRANARIKKEIDEIEAIAAAHSKEHIDTNDLNAERTRLYALRDRLGELLERLRGSRCIDLRGERFTSGVKELVQTLCPGLAIMRPRSVAAASDILERGKEIYDLFGNRDAERALKRLMDLAQEFSDDRTRVRKAIAIHMNYGELAQARGENLEETVGVAMKLRERIVIEALELVDTIVEGAAA